MELSPGYSRRAGLTAAATLSIRSGIGLQGFRTGLAATLPTAREVIGTDGALRTFDLCARAAWSPEWTLAPQLGVELGISKGEWSEAGERLHTRALPVAAADAGLVLRLSPRLSLSAVAGARAELAQTQIQVGDSAPVNLTPVQLELGVALRWQIP